MRNVTRQLWNLWLVAVSILGTIQMVLLLTVVYVLFISVLFIPAGLVADPLKLRKTGRSTWQRRLEFVEGIESLRRQG